jgi:hypothetical protein
MATINRAGVAYARSLISAGSVNKSGSWSFSADDGNALLGSDDDWANYGKHFLGVDTSATKNTKAYWKYPFAKGGKLYRAGLVAIRDRAGQQKDTDVFDAAGTLLDAVDKGKSFEAFGKKALAFELKDVSPDDGTFTGYGAVFGNVDQGGDVIRQGAFTDSLAAWQQKGKLPKMLWQHNSAQPIGVWTSMQQDTHGLLVQGKFTKGVQCADEAYALLKDGAIDGLSIGYQTVDADYDSDLGIRSLSKLNLMEVSLVTLPMNQLATVTSVKAAEQVRTIREFEDFLRDVGGYSHAAAKSIAAGGFKAIRSEPRDEDEIGDIIAGPFSELAELIRK